MHKKQFKCDKYLTGFYDGQLHSRTKNMSTHHFILYCQNLVILIQQTELVPQPVPLLLQGLQFLLQAGHLFQGCRLILHGEEVEIDLFKESMMTTNNPVQETKIQFHSLDLKCKPPSLSLSLSLFFCNGRYHKCLISGVCQKVTIISWYRDIVSKC